jgi:UDP-N-acetylmuramoylalanine--D-glutamate ligase
MLLEEWLVAGREIAVVGLGKSGLAATRLLRQRGLRVYASDAGGTPKHEAWSAELRALGASVQLRGHDLDRIRRAGAVVVAPGVPPEAPPLVAARQAGVPIIAEVDLGFSALTATRTIAITGTNGKTTTTSLVAHVLASAGVETLAAGNIGTALCDVVADGRAPAWLALELSSFQLHDAPHIRPAIGVLTNLAANHLDRYPTLEAYYGDKALLFQHADAQSCTITNADDPAAMETLKQVPGRLLLFSTAKHADGWYDRERRVLVAHGQDILARDALPLLGDHNIQNALVAILAAMEVGVPVPAIAAGLRSFTAIAHRVEPIREVGGVLWINDSKSTNVTSTEVAISALDRPFVLLLGGRHKGEPYSRLVPLLREQCRGVIAYGESRPLIEADLGGDVPVQPAHSFADVITSARLLAKPGDAVLLSPACSSYDMFDNYEQRGETFRRAVEAM